MVILLFYVNKLKLFKAIDEGINPKMESMFAVGVDEMSWDDLNEEHYDWPSIEETKEYRAKVKELVNSIIDKNYFELLHREDIEFTLQESKRRFQYTIAEASVCRLKRR